MNDPKQSPRFSPRTSVKQVEEGFELAPRFDQDGLIPVVTTDAASGEVLMHGYMNAEALRRTLELGEAVYWSRSRQSLWHKGATSGLVQKVIEVRVDDDQDAIWLRVEVRGGASCHVGYRSCFYRRVPIGEPGEPAGWRLTFTETEKVFDPEQVYGDAPNPTRL
ncbi:MAG TPA: phosphoribosyl-AMP cyclohydrolase [Thermoanaerobaculia bacterium]|nr:phosphoribosyl-AMP cyclohydrolase [Thermoanaerobaculia bacterium]